MCIRSNGIHKLTETVDLSVLARPPLEFQVHLFPEDKKKVHIEQSTEKIMGPKLRPGEMTKETKGVEVK